MSDDKRDACKLHEWVEIPAMAGDPESMYLMANAYYDCRLLPIDYYKAEEWAMKAIDAGYDRAEHVVEEVRTYGWNDVADSIEQAVELDYKNAIDGDIFSMYSMGDRYRFGKGVEVNKEKAIAWFLRSGNGRSRSALDEMLESGEWEPVAKPNPRKVRHRGPRARISRSCPKG